MSLLLLLIRVQWISETSLVLAGPTENPFGLVHDWRKQRYGWMYLCQSFGMGEKGCIPFAKFIGGRPGVFGRGNKKVLFASRTKVLDDEVITIEGDKTGILMHWINLIVCLKVIERKGSEIIFGQVGKR